MNNLSHTQHLTIALFPRLMLKQEKLKFLPIMNCLLMPLWLLPVCHSFFPQLKSMGSFIGMEGIWETLPFFRLSTILYVRIF